MMITGGKSNDIAGKSVEAFYLNGTKMCDLPDLPGTTYWHRLNNLLYCAGGTCRRFSEGEWKVVSGRRRQHSTWRLKDGVMLLGGYYPKSRTAIVYDNGTTVEGFALKHNAYRYIEYRTVIKRIC